jgi:alpha-galactosidase
MAISAAAKSWILESVHSAYSFGLNSQGLLAHCYWGQRLPRAEDYPAPLESPGWASFNGAAHIIPEEYPAPGGTKYVEPCLKLTYADGTRDAPLVFESDRLIDENELVIQLHDRNFPLRVGLHYRLHPKTDLLERWATFENLGTQPVTLERAFSAQWHLPRFGDYRLSHLSGRWLDEFHIQRQPLKPGLTVLESRRITTSHHANPWFAVDRGAADEEQGEVWFGALAWSGNWKISAETTDFYATRVNIGLNDWDFAWQLTPGAIFTTPSALAGYTRLGFGDASRRLHDYVRDEVLPHGQTTHKVLYNSWEATTFQVDVPSQSRLAERAAAMGVELFVIDDGWFHGRDSDNAGLGDWWPDKTKFPDGLTPLIEKVQQLGMQFGLWVEPEMVNPDSELYRAHPDWVIHFPTRERTEARNQLILNLGRRDVQDHLIAMLDRLLSENAIRFIKWDMNRNVSEPGWPDAPGDPRELWVRYVQGVYRVWGELRTRHPQVVWQSCSGGGGRVDLGILRLADQAWVSDNTEATARLRIQEGFSQLFPANTMEAWVTDAGHGRIPLDFRFHVSMCGSLGVGGDLLYWSEEERTRAAHWIALYKEIRETVQFGDQYRLRSAQDAPFSAVMYVDKDRSQGVLFAFRTHIPEPVTLPPLHLKGLDPQRLYEVEGVEGARSGLAWEQVGVNVMLADFESAVLRIRAVEENSSQT